MRSAWGRVLFFTFRVNLFLPQTTIQYLARTASQELLRTPIFPLEDLPALHWPSVEEGQRVMKCAMGSCVSSYVPPPSCTCA